MQRQQFIPRNLEQIRRHAIEQRKLREEKEKNNANIKRKSSAPNNDLDAIRQIMNSKTTDEIQSKYFDVDRQKKHMIKMLHDYRIYNETYIYEIFKFIEYITAKVDAVVIRDFSDFLETFAKTVKDNNK
ncbi:hypothetical protein N9V56_00800 [Alphaproteobacteria bacterium]|nr:hypothetical protein [Alphaproteobacteria bacterium]